MKSKKNIDLKKLLKSKDYCLGIANDFNKQTFQSEEECLKIPFEDWPKEWKKVFHKEYPRFKKIALKPSKNLLDKNLFSILSKRKSGRSFDKEKERVSFKELSTLLHFSLGINKQSKTKQNKFFRFYPSAGARYPIEAYILSKGNELSTNPCSYHFNVKRDSLEELFAIKDYKKLINECFVQDWIDQADYVVCLSAVFNRSKVKYGERAYRYCLFELGHIMQNIYLISSALGLKCCSLGGFYDDKINNFLSLNSDEESVLYAVTIGR